MFLGISFWPAKPEKISPTLTLNSWATCRLSWMLGTAFGHSFQSPAVSGHSQPLTCLSRQPKSETDFNVDRQVRY